MVKPKEECGVFGVYGVSDASKAVYYGLFALQHRGQESCGIVSNQNRELFCHKDMGLVNEVFTDDILATLLGNIAIGHVRYSTTGQSVRANAQPLVTKYVKGTLAISHNGNLSNGAALREKFEHEGFMFQTTIDSEVIAYNIAKERKKTKSVEAAVLSAMKDFKGAYSLLVMSPEKLIAARDPYGFRPLCIGTLGDGYVFASESCALDAVGAQFLRDVEPGEVVVATKDGLVSLRDNMTSSSARCIFEYIYFARPDSRIDGISVYEARLAAGRALAKRHPVEADLVIGVPDSGIDAAIGYSRQSGIPYGKGFVKNSYVGRTFIKPSQDERTKSVNIKLNPVREEIEGKRVVMVDDSIVRSTTCRRIVSMLKEAGAKEVHVAISSPPFRHPCYFGTDIPSRQELIATHHDVDGICRVIGADSLTYLDFDDLPSLLCGKNYGICDACFSGHYPKNTLDEMDETQESER